jgi:hypothetical protein
MWLVDESGENYIYDFVSYLNFELWVRTMVESDDGFGGYVFNTESPYNFDEESGMLKLTINIQTTSGQYTVELDRTPPQMF